MNDLTFTNEGDLNLQWVEGAQVLLNSVRRRLATNPFSYSRLVRTLNGTQELGSTFGSRLNEYIALPEKEFNQSDIKTLIEQSLNEDPKITLVEVSTQRTNINVLFTPSNSQNVLSLTIN